MTKIVKLISAGIAILTLFGLLCTCKAGNKEAVNEENSNDNPVRVLYTDDCPIEIEYDDLKLKVGRPSYLEIYDCSLSVDVALINNTYSTKVYNVKNVRLIKESTGANYTVHYTSTLRIEAELKSSLIFSATIPTSPSKDNYKLDFEINSHKFSYYLYDMPDDLKADRTVKYYIDGKLVQTKVVKDKQTVTSYVYESADRQFYCSTWYVDEIGKEIFNLSSPITRDMELYGFKRPRYRTVKYYVSNQLVKTETVKDGEKVQSLYKYDYDDNMFYCDEWYINETAPFNFSNPITSDISVYGANKKSNFRFSTTSSDLYSLLTGVTHYPSSGILVIPEKHEGKELYIFAYALQYLTDINKIYIPKTVRRISSGNFVNMRDKTIYYEGTKEEWEALFDSPSYVVTTNVVYNADYPR